MEMGKHKNYIEIRDRDKRASAVMLEQPCATFIRDWEISKRWWDTRKKMYTIKSLQFKMLTILPRRGSWEKSWSFSLNETVFFSSSKIPQRSDEKNVRKVLIKSYTRFWILVSNAWACQRQRHEFSVLFACWDNNTIMSLSFFAFGRKKLFGSVNWKLHSRLIWMINALKYTI